MRYRIGETPVDGAYGSSGDFVTLTVWVTFAIGCGFLIVGIRAKQRWLAVWGALTLIACGVYGYFGLEPLLGS